MGEDTYWEGTEYEAWGEIPQERERLLRKAQLAINRYTAKINQGTVHSSLVLFPAIFTKAIPATKL